MGREWTSRLYGIRLAGLGNSSTQGECPHYECEQPILKSLWEQRPHWLRAFHVSHQGDSTIAETIANVATSLPFILIGLRAPRTKALNELYADSLIGVGCASSLFHLSRGKARKYFRWADYTMIATSTLCLSRALQPDKSKALFLVSAVLLPFQPFMVAALHTGLMEATFLRRATEQPSLRKTHICHALSVAVGASLFIAEDIYPDIPFLHAGWHVSAALGVATCNQLLDK